MQVGATGPGSVSFIQGAAAADHWTEGCSELQNRQEASLTHFIFAVEVASVFNENLANTTLPEERSTLYTCSIPFIKPVRVGTPHQGALCALDRTGTDASAHTHCTTFIKPPPTHTHTQTNARVPYSKCNETYVQTSGTSGPKQRLRRGKPTGRRGGGEKVSHPRTHKRTQGARARALLPQRTRSASSPPVAHLLRSSPPRFRIRVRIRARARGEHARGREEGVWTV
jgi:hypothetical protein